MKKVDHLADLFRVSHYNLTLKPDKEAMTFAGTVEIIGSVKKPTQTIKIHSHGLDIKKAEFSIGGGKHGARKLYHLDNDELQIDFTTEIQKDVTLFVEFEGKITEPMVGIYPCNFTVDDQKKKLIATQFESHHAREVFPCVDEPKAKATFDLTLHTPIGEKVLANTPIKSQEQKGETLVTTFETTPKMSTYLLAFAFGEIDYLERTTKDGVQVRTWATAENVAHTAFALDVAVKCLEFYNEYFGIPYPLAKCDNVALPDFSSGAMENWGMITYRESGLIVDSENTSLNQKQWVALVIAHELAHQWFGNLVTMEWWKDLWLNEGFASWVEYLAVDELFPDWQMWTQFVTDDYLHGQSLDALASTHPIEVSVDNPDQIGEIFDAISYKKGSSIVRMLHAYLGPDDFKNGMQHYLKSHSYENATTSDLWSSLETISKKPVADFMGRWTSQAGFPLLDVKDSEDLVEFSQARYMVSPIERKKSEDSSTWPLPIDATGSDKIYMLDEKSKSWKIDLSTVPKFNTNQTGFYLTNYSSSYLRKLGAKVKKGELEPIDRLGLLNDAFQLAKAGFKPTTDALKLLEKYSSEDNAAVWDVIDGQLGSIRRVNDSDELRDLIRPYVDKLVTLQLERLGWEESPADTHFDKLLRPTILSLASFAENPKIVKDAVEVFASAKKPEDIHPDIRGVVYSTVVRHGSKKEFEKLLSMYRETNSSQSKTRLAGALTGFRQPVLIAEALNLIKSKEVKLQEVVYWVAFTFSNRHAKDVAWVWLKENWSWLEKNFGRDVLNYSYFPKIAAGSFSTDEFAAQYQEFFASVDTTRIQRSVDQGLETILWQAAWKKRDEKLILEYFSNKKSTPGQSK